MAESMYPNLRMWEPTDSQAKCVEDTKMLNTEAHETPDTVTDVNDNKELVNPGVKFGPLGAKGRE